MSLTLSLRSMARQAAPVQANRQAFWTSYSGSLAQEAAPIAELGTSPTCFGYQLHIGLSLSAVCRPSLSLGMVPRHWNGLALLQFGMGIRWVMVPAWHQHGRACAPAWTQSGGHGTSALEWAWHFSNLAWVSAGLRPQLGSSTCAGWVSAWAGIV